MPRRATGALVERRTKRGVVYALRFYAAGERRYETLGTDAQGWNRRKAEDEASGGHGGGQDWHLGAFSGQDLAH